LGKNKIQVFNLSGPNLLLDPFVFFQKMLEAEQYLTSSLVPMMVYLVQDKLQEISNAGARTENERRLNAAAAETLADFNDTGLQVSNFKLLFCFSSVPTFRSDLKYFVSNISLNTLSMGLSGVSCRSP
jgi:hypothetical protein